MRAAAPALLALALLVTTLPGGAAPVPATYDLAAVKAQLQRDLPSPEWALLPDHAVPTGSWDFLVPAGHAVALTFDPLTKTLTADPDPGADHGGEDAGCTDYGGAFAVWMPSPPEVYPLCQGYSRHQGAITEVMLVCAGVSPGFGCAQVGIDYPRNDYWGLLCGFPAGPLVGAEWPDRDLHLHCETFGDDISAWSDWAITLSANGPLFTTGTASHGG